MTSRETCGKMAVSLGVYAFVVSLVLVAAIAGGAVYISNLKQDLNVCKVRHSIMNGNYMCVLL